MRAQRRHPRRERRQPTQARQGGARTPCHECGCAWLTFVRKGREAPSQAAAARLRSEGYAGMLVPSFVPGAAADAFNLVLWDWRADLPHKVEVYDPSGRLPRDRRSWE